ncbi:LysM peptidoglycan-binding domain-containing protein [Streptacidiphilus rugosus]|uniref:LysM peptidoglycan-binding domain-containing protein n=1 Tax=Streptacidiphilus rugosus TaxID=405783 RepID=UPI00055EC18C|nr:transglycosylase family protein [Streptacidiphilus rugosus]
MFVNRHKKLIGSLILASPACVLPMIGAVSAHADSSQSVWDRVATCESTNNWQINTGNGFYGGLQFTQSTWDAYGGTAFAPRADMATKDQQITVAQAVLAGQGPGAWPVCSVEAGLTEANGSAAMPPASSASDVTQTSQTSQASQTSQTTPSDNAARSASSSTAASVSSTSASSHSYTVQSGDTLTNIAQNLHLKGGWRALWERNQGVVGGNPNYILPGQVLSV